MPSVADALGSLLGGTIPGYGAEGPPPGTAGPAQAGQPVVYDPGTGLYVNKATGAVSTDPAGRQIVQDPSLATQAARNLATSENFLSSIGEYGKQYSGAQAAESSLAGQLNNTISGTAPSVARQQLEQGLSQIAQQQTAQAAGANGEGAALAREAAMRNTAGAQLATNQQSAGLRAQEVGQAEQALGGVLSNQANQAQAATGSASTSAGNFAQLAGGEEGNRESLTQSGGQNQLNTLGTILSAGGDALKSNGGGGGGGGSTAAALGATASDPDVKEDMKPADMHDFMSKLAAITFDYKNPEKYGDGKRVGVKATDVNKSKVGKGITVGKDPIKLDNGNAIGAALAGIADLHKRLSKVESHGR